MQTSKTRFGIPVDEIKRIQKTYKAGMRVMLDRMDGEPYMHKGLKGTVRGVDNLGSIMVNWDNGSSLNVAYGDDECHIISETE